MIFSVVIPCYNCVKTLEATVNSIRACGLTDYEILLVDDGSSDGTAKLCDTLCVRYPELRCVHQKNAGVSAARNRGIDEARGEYLWFVDADDTVDVGALSDAADTIDRQQPDMLLFGISFDYYHHGKLYRRDKLVPPCAGNLTLEQLKKQFQEFYECNALTTACNKFMRRDILMQSGVRFREDMILMEDFLFVLELLPYCQNIYSLRRQFTATVRQRMKRVPIDDCREFLIWPGICSRLKPVWAHSAFLRRKPRTFTKCYCGKNSIMRRCVKFAGFLRSKNKVNTLF